MKIVKPKESVQKEKEIVRFPKIKPENALTLKMYSPKVVKLMALKPAELKESLEKRRA